MVPFRSADELVARVAEHLQAEESPLTNWNDSALLRILTTALVQPTADLYAALFKVLTQGFVASASGPWLRAHAEGLGVEPLPAVRTRGYVTFIRELGELGNIVIPVEARVGTKVGPDGERIVFRPVEQHVLAEGDETTEVLCEAELAGASGNVGLGSIVELLAPVAGIAGVNNIGNWLSVEGADEESDDKLKARLLGLWNALGYGSNRAAYKLWALSVPGVSAVWVDDNHPRGQGTVDVYVMGVAGPPSSALLLAVDEVVQARRSLTANVQVLGPVAIPVTVEVVVELSPSSGVLAELKQRATRRIEAYFRVGEPIEDVVPINVAEDVRPGRLGRLVGHPDVYDVQIVQPPGIIEIGPGEIAQLDTLTVTAVRLDEL